MAPLATVPETGACSAGGADRTRLVQLRQLDRGRLRRHLGLARRGLRGSRGSGWRRRRLRRDRSAPFSTKPCPGTTPARRSETGSAWTAVPSTPPIASQSNVPGRIWSTQVSACSPERSRTPSPALTVHRTGPRRKTTTPSGTGTTIPNGATSPAMWPRTQPASRAATAVAGASRSAARSATRPRSSFALASVAPPREIRTTVSPNRPTRSLPGSMLTRMVTVNSTQAGTSRGSDGQALRGFGEIHRTRV